MDDRTEQQLQDLRAELAPEDERPPTLVAAFATGRGRLGVLAELAAQQRRIITSDRRSLLLLATRRADTPLGAWFAGLADGESAALRTLPALATACGLSPEEAAARPPLPGCQAYPAYLAWLALNGQPTAVAGALVANFAAWGGYCATLAGALRRFHGLGEEACAFFDFFAQPATALERAAAEAIGPGGLTAPELDAAREYGRLLQAYEQLFWKSLAELPGDWLDERNV
ncbi:transcriptional regulator [Kitasatospora sp. NPDC093806]|uniref:transcriptional regulator n=1 Tax=Kitasatospora sp. NPDC093806 TaxID=3155075 RepID=UPI0034314AAD